MNSKTSGVGFLSRFQLLVQFSVLTHPLTFIHDSFHDIYIYIYMSFSFFFPSFMFYNLTEIKGSKSFST